MNAVLSNNVEVIRSIEPYVSEHITDFLLDIETCWQPTDFLPDMSKEESFDEIRALQTRAKNIPDEVMVSLIGNMITEEALPSYQTYFNLVDGLNEGGGQASANGWGRWSRGWTAEENRHGDLLNKYLYLSGRADMGAVERTIQNLINNGFDPQIDVDPYCTMVYTSFQERATKISHVNTGKLADKAGDVSLSRICKTIAGDEARHERAYKTFLAKVFEVDPNGAMLAFEHVMRSNIVMPAVLMDGAKQENLYVRYSQIAQKMGIYTTWDYAQIIDHLVKFWKIESFTGLNSCASKAQDYLCKLSARYARIADRMKAPTEINLAWLSV